MTRARSAPAAGMRKILVIGCPGAGKSVFARRLRDALGLPLYHLDLFWHRADRTTVSEEEFDKKLGAVLQEERWIIDGNYARTLESRLAACDTVFLLDYPLGVCLAGAAARVGTPREDLPWVETEFDAEFRQWIEEFPQKQLPPIYAALRRCGSEKTVVVFKSRADADKFLASLS